MENHLEAIFNMLKAIFILGVFGQATSIIFEIRRNRR